MYLEFHKRNDGRVMLTVVEEDGARRSAIVSDALEVLRLPAAVQEATESLRGIWRDLPHGDMLTLTIQ
jgi:hypothetical protein